MRLISLSANKKSFKTVTFNRLGASFILAKQDNPEQNDDNNKTYNGVGKSLLAALIDFCLGAGTTSKITKSLQNSLADWCFTLNIEIDKQPYQVTREVNTPKRINFNNELLELNDFYQEIQNLCFHIPTGFQYLTYRSLLPFFLRPSKRSYLNYDEPMKAGTPYQKQLYNAFLLGLDIDLADKKMRLKKEKDETKKLHNNIKQDPILKQFFQGYQDSSLALADMSEKIEKLEFDLEQFEVAEDYYQIKQEADEIKKDIDQTQNQIRLKKNNIDNIDKSLQIRPDVNRQDIEKIYEESKLVFKAGVEKQLLELEKFYADLTVNRTMRLKHQRDQIRTELKSLEEKFKNLKGSLDEHLKFLNAHQALDVFTKVNSQLAELQQQRDKLQGYEKLQHDYEQKKIALDKEMITQSQKATEYIEEIKDKLKEIMDYFRVLVKQFYPDSLAGIKIHNNDGKNQIRYDIEAKIQSDASDGINSVKLFCYDLTTLLQGSNHHIDFIFHDSRLFSDIDELHCNELFKIVKDKFADKQYIASINQNQLNALSEDVQDFVKQHVVLELTDDSDDGKLLGITVELEYD